MQKISHIVWALEGGGGASKFLCVNLKKWWGLYLLQKAAYGLFLEIWAIFAGIWLPKAVFKKNFLANSA